MNIFDQISAAAPKRELTVAEARALTRAARAGDSQATLQLLSNYLPLLKRIIGETVTDVNGHFADTDELRSAAMEGFLDALNVTNLGDNDHVGKYVQLRVMDRVRTVRTDLTPVRIPSSTYARCIEALADFNQDQAAALDHAADYNITRSTMQAVFTAMTTVQQRAEESYELSQRPVLQAEDEKDASRALAVLDPRERLVIETLFGFGATEPMSERDASATLGIPRTTLQRIARSALSKMRTALGA